MDAFEYLGVFISIILGLGVTQLLGAVAGVLRDRGQVRPDATPLAWAATLLLAHVQAWWSLFGLRGREDWSFAGFCAVLLPPALLYLLSALVLPPPGARLDLAPNFARHRRVFHGLLLALVVASLGRDLVLLGQLPDAGNLAFHGGFALAATLGLASARPAVQRALALALLAAFAGYSALLFARLG